MQILLLINYMYFSFQEVHEALFYNQLFYVTLIISNGLIMLFITTDFSFFPHPVIT